jgi:glycosyltransferase involved in cell wall biosynthesis
MPSSGANGRPRVLVVGPVGGIGGMAAVARQTADSAHLPGWDIAVIDTAEGTREGAGRIRSLLGHAAQFGRMLAVLMRDRPKIAHLHTCSYLTFVRTMPDILACRCLRANVVLHVHGGFFDRFLEGLHPLSRWIVHAHLRLCHRLIVLGEAWRSRLGTVVPGLSIEVIPNAVKVSALAARATGRCGRRILFVGDLARTKGVDDLIEAVARLPEPLRRGLCVRIVGDGASGRARQVARLGPTDRAAGPAGRRRRSARVPGH